MESPPMQNLVVQAISRISNIDEQNTVMHFFTKFENAAMNRALKDYDRVSYMTGILEQIQRISQDGLKDGGDPEQALRDIRRLLS